MTTFTKEDREAVEKAMNNKPVGQLCIGCGSSWDDERLTREKRFNPELISCCPDRRMVDVYTRPAELTDDEIKEAIKAWGKDYFKDDYTDPQDEDFADILPMLRAVLKTATTKERK